MTEAEWLTCANPRWMLNLVTATASETSERKLRLFAVASFRRVLDMNSDGWGQTIDIAEQYADARAEDREVRDFHIALISKNARAGSSFPIHPNARVAARGAVVLATDMRRSDDPDGVFGRIEEVPFQAALLRDIFGNPFRPAALDPAWRTSDVMLLATGIYAEGAFDRMPILADALQDAGCDSDDILTHLRDPHATHVRGCWALDLVLGKV